MVLFAIYYFNHFDDLNKYGSDELNEDNSNEDNSDEDDLDEDNSDEDDLDEDDSDEDDSDEDDSDEDDSDEDDSEDNSNNLNEDNPNEDKSKNEDESKNEKLLIAEICYLFDLSRFSKIPIVRKKYVEKDVCNSIRKDINIISKFKGELRICLSYGLFVFLGCNYDFIKNHARFKETVIKKLDNIINDCKNIEKIGKLNEVIIFRNYIVNDREF